MAGQRWIINFLMPLALIIYGYLYKYKASKNLNNFFGYKTRQTQLSQKTWEYANRRVGSIWMKLGGLYGLLVGLYLLVFPSQRQGVSILVIIGAFVVALYPFSIIEKELKEKFDDKGEPK